MYGHSWMIVPRSAGPRSAATSRFSERVDRTEISLIEYGSGNRRTSRARAVGSASYRAFSDKGHASPVLKWAGGQRYRLLRRKQGIFLDGSADPRHMKFHE
jgi:hypothetical protein